MAVRTTFDGQDDSRVNRRFCNSIFCQKHIIFCYGKSTGNGSCAGRTTGGGLVPRGSQMLRLAAQRYAGLAARPHACGSGPVWISRRGNHQPAGRPGAAALGPCTITRREPQPSQRWDLLWTHFHPRPNWIEWLNWPEVSPGLMRLRLENRKDQAPNPAAICRHLPLVNSQLRNRRARRIGDERTGGSAVMV